MPIRELGVAVRQALRLAVAVRQVLGLEEGQLELEPELERAAAQLLRERAAAVLEREPEVVVPELGQVAAQVLDYCHCLKLEVRARQAADSSVRCELEPEF
jgi:hypothetical protein